MSKNQCIIFPSFYTVINNIIILKKKNYLIKKEQIIIFFLSLNLFQKNGEPETKIKIKNWQIYRPLIRFICK